MSWIFETQDSPTLRLAWAGLAFLLHVVLFLAMPTGKAEAPRLPAPIQVSLLESALTPMPMEKAAPPASEPPRPKPAPRQTSRPQPTPEPLPETSDAETVAESAPAASVTPAAPPLPESGEPSSAANERDATPDHDNTLVEARFDAAYLRNPAPPYPPASKRLREEGRVELRVHVLADGSAGKVDVWRGSGHARLDESARATVEKWRFVPARRGEQAIDSWAIVPISFIYPKES
jgi:protein TonB